MRSQTVKLRCPAAAAAEISSDATGLLDSHKRLVERAPAQAECRQPAQLNAPLISKWHSGLPADYIRNQVRGCRAGQRRKTRLLLCSHS